MLVNYPISIHRLCASSSPTRDLHDGPWPTKLSLPDSNNEPYPRMYHANLFRFSRPLGPGNPMNGHFLFLP
jgi:hypothetical protein